LDDNLSELENWILAFLGIADDEHIPRTPHTGGGLVRYTKATTNAFQLATVIPQTVLATLNSKKDIQNTFDKLIERGFLERVPDQGYPEEMKGVSITLEGMIAFRKHVRPIAQALKTEEYENTIDKIQAESWVKEEFKKLKAKLRDKAEDEVIGEIFAAVRRTGYYYGIITINEIIKNLHHVTTGNARPDLNCDASKSINKISGGCDPCIVI
jgi:DNA-binding MarR family transcriptional regulator